MLQFLFGVVVFIIFKESFIMRYVPPYAGYVILFVNFIHVRIHDFLKLIVQPFYFFTCFHLSPLIPKLT